MLAGENRSDNDLRGKHGRQVPKPHAEVGGLCGDLDRLYQVIATNDAAAALLRKLLPQGEPQAFGLLIRYRRGRDLATACGRFGALEPPRPPSVDGSLAVIQKIDRLFKVPADGKRKGAAVCVASGYRSGESAVHGRAL